MAEGPPGCPIVAWEEVGAPQESSSPPEPDEVCVIQPLQADASWLAVYEEEQEMVDFIQAFLKSSEKEETKKVWFLECICTLCRAARHKGLLQGLDVFCHRFELAKSIKLGGDGAGGPKEKPHTCLLHQCLLASSKRGHAGPGCFSLLPDAADLHQLQKCSCARKGLEEDSEAEPFAGQMFLTGGRMLSEDNPDHQEIQREWEAESTSSSSLLHKAITLTTVCKNYFWPSEKTDIVATAIEAMRDSSTYDKQVASSMLNMAMREPASWLTDVPSIVRCIHESMKYTSTASAWKSLCALLILLACEYPKELACSMAINVPPYDRYRSRQPLGLVPRGERGPETLWLPDPQKTAGHPPGAGPSIPPHFPALVGHPGLQQPKPAKPESRATTLLPAPRGPPPQPSPACPHKGLRRKQISTAVLHACDIQAALLLSNRSLEA
ncbi:uncharacterized protein LOC142092526 [Calonectris borealis]|uniref:uncharacterized protein LOC142092526 n=1 Tax=Calonectris borealis TaxID=1323832 RepID=UPI003F4B0E94